MKILLRILAVLLMITMSFNAYFAIWGEGYLINQLLTFGYMFFGAFIASRYLWRVSRGEL